MRIRSPRSSRERTPFIGRQRECDQLHAALDRGAGLISLTGPSGIGKTRLARLVAAERVDLMEADGGVWFCSLAGCANPADLESAVARTLGIHHGQGDALSRGIANRGPLLLVLDNADPIVEGLEGVLGRWLEKCVELQMVVTSLAPVDVPGALAIELRPLELDDAVALYLDRASSAWADRSFSQEETATVQELVRRLDRFPLAIELAAGRVRVLPPKLMLSMVEQRFALLRSSSFARLPAAPHHASLLGALELSWQHLEPAEQRALAQASIFEGDFDVEAATQVLDPGPTPAPTATVRREEVALLLDGLHQRALLDRKEVEPPRFSLLESVRAFALQELDRMGDGDRLARRHADYFLGKWVLQELPAITPPALPHEMTELEKDWEELTAIHRRYVQTEPAVAAKAGVALTPLLLRGGIATQGALVDSTLDAARRSADPKLILAAWDLSAEAHFLLGAFKEAMAALEEASALSRETGEEVMEAFSLSRLAICQLQRRDIQASYAPLQRAAEISAKLDAPQVRGWVLSAQGIQAIESGDFELAERCLRAAIELLQVHGTELSSRYHLGLVLARQRKHADMRRVMHEAVDLCLARGFRSLGAHILANLTHLELGAGFLEEAQTQGERALELFQELGLRFREASHLMCLGMIALEQEDLDLAEERLSTCTDFYQGDPEESPSSFKITLALLEALRHQFDAARRLLAQARTNLEETDEETSFQLEGAEAILEVREAWEFLLAQPKEAEAKVKRARERLTLIHHQKLPAPTMVPVFSRLLERELSAWELGERPLRPQPSSAVLTVGPTFEWFRSPRGDRIDLRGRKFLRRIFEALAQARLDTPGAWVDSESLLRAGWPEVKHGPPVPAHRLHAGAWTLRSLGLGTLMQSTPKGYRLDPHVPLLREPEAASEGQRNAG